MNKKQLRQIVKEEIRKVLKEEWDTFDTDEIEEKDYDLSVGGMSVTNKQDAINELKKLQSEPNSDWKYIEGIQFFEQLPKLGNIDEVSQYLKTTHFFNFDKLKYGYALAIFYYNNTKLCLFAKMPESLKNLDEIAPSQFIKNKFPSVIDYDRVKRGFDIYWTLHSTEKMTVDNIGDFQKYAGYHPAGYDGPNIFREKILPDGTFEYTWTCYSSSD